MVMEAMHTAYTKKQDSVLTRLKLHMKQTITEDMQVLWRESVHCLQTTVYFVE